MKDVIDNLQLFCREYVKIQDGLAVNKIEFNTTKPDVLIATHFMQKNYSNIIGLDPLLGQVKDYDLAKSNCYLIIRAIASDTITCSYLLSFIYKDVSGISLENEMDILDKYFAQNMFNFLIHDTEAKYSDSLVEERKEYTKIIVENLRPQLSHLINLNPNNDLSLEQLCKNLKENITIRRNSLFKPNNNKKDLTEKGKSQLAKRVFSELSIDPELNFDLLYRDFIFFSQYQHYSPRSMNFFYLKEIANEFEYVISTFEMLLRATVLYIGIAKIEERYYLPYINNASKYFMNCM